MSNRNTKPNIRMKFQVVIDELDFEETKPEYFEVSARTEDDCWELAETEANARCFRYGKIREYSLNLIIEGDK